jgi:rubrerythrin
MKVTSVEEVLKFAIRKEADAAAFYRMAAERSNPGVQKTFEELAKEEEGHKKRLEKFDPAKVEQMEVKEAKGLGLAELMEDVPYSSDMNYATFSEWRSERGEIPTALSLHLQNDQGTQSEETPSRPCG